MSTCLDRISCLAPAAGMALQRWTSGLHSLHCTLEIDPSIDHGGRFDWTGDRPEETREEHADTHGRDKAALGASCKT